MQKETTCIIIDDEAKARLLLEHLINKVDNITVLDRCSDLDLGISSILKYRPDIVFLDIQMPNKFGLELFEYFETPAFQVIFVTAYDEYALKAFELSAVDYLLKPINPERLKKAIEKAKNNKLLSTQAKLLKSNLQKTSKKISLIKGGLYFYRDICTIICVEAKRSYCDIYFSKERFTISKPLSRIEQLFKEENCFIRVHRSWLIHKEFIASVSFSENCIHLKNKMSVPIGKSYKNKLKSEISS